MLNFEIGYLFKLSQIIQLKKLCFALNILMLIHSNISVRSHSRSHFVCVCNARMLYANFTWLFYLIRELYYFTDYQNC